MIRVEPHQPPQPPTKFEFLEYLKEIRWFDDKTWFDKHNTTWDDTIILADFETYPDLLEWFEVFQSKELRKRVFMSIFEECFNSDWRSGQEVHKVVITKRLYQTSPYSTQD